MCALSEDFVYFFAGEGFEDEALGLEAAVGSFFDLWFDVLVVCGDEDGAEVVGAGEVVEKVVALVH